jgi:hypothetical protein
VSPYGPVRAEIRQDVLEAGRRTLSRMARRGRPALSKVMSSGRKLAGRGIPGMNVMDLVPNPENSPTMRQLMRRKGPKV